MTFQDNFSYLYRRQNNNLDSTGEDLTAEGALLLECRLAEEIHYASADLRANVTNSGFIQGVKTVHKIGPFQSKSVQGILVVLRITSYSYLLWNYQLVTHCHM